MTDQSYITGYARVLWERASGKLSWAEALRMARAALAEIKARDSHLNGKA